ncbi:MAG TPA: glucosamine-6-phosphate deaminase [Dehalococcoidia bacterium]|nr:glucosamine-6-phosphate deaminase [Dehalococcoidia bacterium]
MRIDVLADEDGVAQRAADTVCETVRARPEAHIGLPTGRTPVGAYTELARREDAGAVDFSRATGHAIDEFAGVPATTPGTNADFFRRHVRLRLKALHCPMSAARYPDVHIRAFAESIRFGGGLDLCVLGIGVNGHIAFNEPGSPRDAVARVVELTEETRAAHADAFGSVERVPARGMTLGVADLMEARELVVLATGAHKAAAVRAAIEGEPSAAVPASWLQGHAAVTWLLDAAAAALLGQR